MRAAIYARLSSDLLDERSITDQIALAQKYIDARGLTLTQTYQDAAISGRVHHEPARAPELAG